MQIEDGQVVTIEYVLKDVAGKVLESSSEGGAISFRFGVDRMLPGLARAMVGMAVGETRTGVIPPGELVPAASTAYRVVQASEFPAGTKMAVGDRFGARGPDGRPLQFEVSEIQADGAARVHLLHALHDVEVHYEVKVVAARKPGLPPPPPVDVPDLSDDLLDEDG
ncbi:MAG: FKBP-type peptidyl-prolyl cis-trans isomerase [Myxococcales bacterium]|nr:FKBP-type peptidyl-prolyl cis-trans isomerase [Myxococcales bacterium]